MNKRAFLPSLLLVMGSLVILPARISARERILQFSSQVHIQENGSMIVKETIRVRSEAAQIRHGIYRDFPTSYRDHVGNRLIVDFQVLSVIRDNNPEPYHLSKQSNGWRVYMGHSNVLLPAGEYSYILTYQTNRQLGFFAHHDELFWNVTGNGWNFPIDKASVQIYLPHPVPRDSLRTDAFTGSQGSHGKSFIARIEDDNSFWCETTRPLNPQEGLTVVLGWEKGLIKEPSRWDKISFFYEDNYEACLAAFGLILVLFYYGVSWLAVGKDPAAGIIIPLYEPPAGLSPSAIRFISKMGYDDKTAAAALVHMAVQGTIKIKLTSYDNYHIERTTDGNLKTLSTDEKTLYDELLRGQESLVLNNSHHGRIRSALNKFKASLKLAHEKNYFVTNRVYFIVAILVSLIAPTILFITGRGTNHGIILFMGVWLSFWTFGIISMISRLRHLWRKIFKSKTHGTESLFGFIFGSIFLMPFLLGELFGLAILGMSASPLFVLLIILTGLTHILFFHLLKAPTMRGRQILDKIDGFKLYLGTADGDRYQNPPLKYLTPEHFEQLLPYAIALDLVDQWSSKFTALFEREGGSSFCPQWFSDKNWSGTNFYRFSTSLGSTIGGVISSASSAPGGSSGFGGGGGGGGGSGGGGGGGGGGGW